LRLGGAKSLLLIAVGLLAGCGHSDAELESAYRDGHRAGIIWCKRLGEPPQPDIAEVLLVRWREGFGESTSLQCASEARKLKL
jgi:hypothetical protein